MPTESTNSIVRRARPRLANSERAIHGVVRGQDDQQPQQKAGYDYRKADFNNAVQHGRSPVLRFPSEWDSAH